MEHIITWQKNKSIVSVTTGKDTEVEDLVTKVHVRNAGVWRRRHMAKEEELDHFDGNPTPFMWISSIWVWQSCTFIHIFIGISEDY